MSTNWWSPLMFRWRKHIAWSKCVYFIVCRLFIMDYFAIYKPYAHIARHHFLSYINTHPLARFPSPQTTKRIFICHTHLATSLLRFMLEFCCFKTLMPWKMYEKISIAFDRSHPWTVLCCSTWFQAFLHASTTKHSLIIKVCISER